MLIIRSDGKEPVILKSHPFDNEDRFQKVVANNPSLLCFDGDAPLQSVTPNRRRRKTITDDELRALVKACSWREARRMKQWPHEYAIVGKTVPDHLYDEFQRFGVRIAAGYVRYFYSKEVRYLTLTAIATGTWGCPRTTITT